MHWKGILVIAIITLVTVAVISRVGFLKTLAFGASAPAASS